MKAYAVRGLIAFFAGMLIVFAAMSAGPTLAAETPASCGNDVCNPNENADICEEDCPCVDNGVVDAGETAKCKDVIGEGETAASACGTPCDTSLQCPAGLACAEGSCWDGVLCSGYTEADEEEEEQSGGGGGGSSCVGGAPDGFCAKGEEYYACGCDADCAGFGEYEDICAATCGNDVCEAGERVTCGADCVAP